MMAEVKQQLFTTFRDAIVGHVRATGLRGTILRDLDSEILRSVTGGKKSGCVIWYRASSHVRGVKDFTPSHAETVGCSLELA